MLLLQLIHTIIYLILPSMLLVKIRDCISSLVRLVLKLLVTICVSVLS